MSTAVQSRNLANSKSSLNNNSNSLAVSIRSSNTNPKTTSLKLLAKKTTNSSERHECRKFCQPIRTRQLVPRWCQTACILLVWLLQIITIAVAAQETTIVINNNNNNNNNERRNVSSKIPTNNAVAVIDESAAVLNANLIKIYNKIIREYEGIFVNSFDDVDWQLYDLLLLESKGYFTLKHAATTNTSLDNEVLVRSGTRSVADNVSAAVVAKFICRYQPPSIHAANNAGKNAEKPSSSTSGSSNSVSNVKSRTKSALLHWYQAKANKLYSALHQHHHDQHHNLLSARGSTVTNDDAADSNNNVAYCDGTSSISSSRSSTAHCSRSAASDKQQHQNIIPSRARACGKAIFCHDAYRHLKSDDTISDAAAVVVQLEAGDGNEPSSTKTTRTNFGKTNMGKVKLAKLRIRNLSRSNTLYIYSAITNAPDFHCSGPTQIAPNTSAFILLAFSPFMASSTGEEQLGSSGHHHHHIELLTSAGIIQHAVSGVGTFAASTSTDSSHLNSNSNNIRVRALHSSTSSSASSLHIDRIPFMTNFTLPIELINFGSSDINIISAYTSGGPLHLTMPCVDGPIDNMALVTTASASSSSSSQQSDLQQQNLFVPKFSSRTLFNLTLRYPPNRRNLFANSAAAGTDCIKNINSNKGSKCVWRRQIRGFIRVKYQKLIMKSTTNEQAGSSMRASKRRAAHAAAAAAASSSTVTSSTNCMQQNAKLPWRERYRHCCQFSTITHFTRPFGGGNNVNLLLPTTSDSKNTTTTADSELVTPSIETLLIPYSIGIVESSPSSDVKIYAVDSMLNFGTIITTTAAAASSSDEPTTFLNLPLHVWHVLNKNKKSNRDPYQIFPSFMRLAAVESGGAGGAVKAVIETDAVPIKSASKLEHKFLYSSSQLLTTTTKNNFTAVAANVADIKVDCNDAFSCKLIQPDISSANGYFPIGTIFTTPTNDPSKEWIKTYSEDYADVAPMTLAARLQFRPEKCYYQAQQQPPPMSALMLRGQLKFRIMSFLTGASSGSPLSVEFQARLLHGDIFYAAVDNDSIQRYWRIRNDDGQKNYSSSKVQLINIISTFADNVSIAFSGNARLTMRNASPFSAAAAASAAEYAEYYLPNLLKISAATVAGAGGGVESDSTAARTVTLAPNQPTPFVSMHLLRWPEQNCHHLQIELEMLLIASDDSGNFKRMIAPVDIYTGLLTVNDTSVRQWTADNLLRGQTAQAPIFLSNFGPLPLELKVHLPVVLAGRTILSFGLRKILSSADELNECVKDFITCSEKSDLKPADLEENYYMDEKQNFNLKMTLEPGTSFMFLVTATISASDTETTTHVYHKLEFITQFEVVTIPISFNIVLGHLTTRPTKTISFDNITASFRMELAPSFNTLAGTSGSSTTVLSRKVFIDSTFPHPVPIESIELLGETRAAEGEITVAAANRTTSLDALLLPINNNDSDDTANFILPHAKRQHITTVVMQTHSLCYNKRIYPLCIAQSALNALQQQQLLDSAGGEDGFFFGGGGGGGGGTTEFSGAAAQGMRWIRDLHALNRLLTEWRRFVDMYGAKLQNTLVVKTNETTLNIPVEMNFIWPTLLDNNNFAVSAGGIRSVNATAVAEPPEIDPYRPHILRMPDTAPNSVAKIRFEIRNPSAEYVLVQIVQLQELQMRAVYWSRRPTASQVKMYAENDAFDDNENNDSNGGDDSFRHIPSKLMPIQPPPPPSSKKQQTDSSKCSVDKTSSASSAPIMQEKFVFDERNLFTIRIAKQPPTNAASKNQFDQLSAAGGVVPSSSSSQQATSSANNLHRLRLHPHGRVKIEVQFMPRLEGLHTTNIVLRNNLSMFDIVHVQGDGVVPNLVFLPETTLFAHSKNNSKIPVQPVVLSMPTTAANVRGGGTTTLYTEIFNFNQAGQCTKLRSPDSIFRQWLPTSGKFRVVRQGVFVNRGRLKLHIRRMTIAGAVANEAGGSGGGGACSSRYFTILDAVPTDSGGCLPRSSSSSGTVAAALVGGGAVTKSRQQNKFITVGPFSNFTFSYAFVPQFDKTFVRQELHIDVDELAVPLIVRLIGMTPESVVRDCRYAWPPSVAVERFYFISLCVSFILLPILILYAYADGSVLCSNSQLVSKVTGDLPTINPDADRQPIRTVFLTGGSMRRYTLMAFLRDILPLPWILCRFILLVACRCVIFTTNWMMLGGDASSKSGKRKSKRIERVAATNNNNNTTLLAKQRLSKLWQQYLRPKMVLVLILCLIKRAIFYVWKNTVGRMVQFLYRIVVRQLFGWFTISSGSPPQEEPLPTLATASQQQNRRKPSEMVAKTDDSSTGAAAAAGVRASPQPKPQHKSAAAKKNTAYRMTNYKRSKISGSSSHVEDDDVFSRKRTVSEAKTIELTEDDEESDNDDDGEEDEPLEEVEGEEDDDEDNEGDNEEDNEEDNVRHVSDEYEFINSETSSLSLLDEPIYYLTKKTATVKKSSNKKQQQQQNEEEDDEGDVIRVALDNDKTILIKVESSRSGGNKNKSQQQQKIAATKIKTLPTSTTTTRTIGKRIELNETTRRELANIVAAHEAAAKQQKVPLNANSVQSSSSSKSAAAPDSKATVNLLDRQRPHRIAASAAATPALQNNQSVTASTVRRHLRGNKNGSLSPTTLTTAAAGSIGGIGPRVGVRYPPQYLYRYPQNAGGVAVNNNYPGMPPYRPDINFAGNGNFRMQQRLPYINQQQLQYSLNPAAAAAAASLYMQQPPPLQQQMWYDAASGQLLHHSPPQNLYEMQQHQQQNNFSMMMPFPANSNNNAVRPAMDEMMMMGGENMLLNWPSPPPSSEQLQPHHHQQQLYAPFIETTPSAFLPPAAGGDDDDDDDDDDENFVNDTNNNYSILPTPPLGPTVRRLSDNNSSSSSNNNNNYDIDNIWGAASPVTFGAPTSSSDIDGVVTPTSSSLLWSSLTNDDDSAVDIASGAVGRRSNSALQSLLFDEQEEILQRNNKANFKNQNDNNNNKKDEAASVWTPLWSSSSSTASSSTKENKKQKQQQELWPTTSSSSSALITDEIQHQITGGADFAVERSSASQQSQSLLSRMSPRIVLAEQQQQQQPQPQQQPEAATKITKEELSAAAAKSAITESRLLPLMMLNGNNNNNKNTQQPSSSGEQRPLIN